MKKQVHEPKLYVIPATEKDTEKFFPNLERALAQAILEAIRYEKELQHKKSAGSIVTKGKTDLRHGEGA